MNIVETYFKTGELDYTGINSIPQEWGETDENLKMSVYHERIGAIYLTETLNIRQARAHLKKAISYHSYNIKAWGNLILTFLVPAHLVRKVRKKYLKARYNI